MSILIKGMEMPKKCEQCWFFGAGSARVGYCYLLKGELPLPDGVPQDCPLVEVPPHGRLIDADVLKRNIAANLPAAFQDFSAGLCFIVDMQRTVIESELEG